MLHVIDLLLKIFWSKLNTKPLPSPLTNSQTNLVCFAQIASPYKTPHQYIQSLRSCLGSGHQSEKQEGVPHFTAQGCPGQQRWDPGEVHSHISNTKQFSTTHQPPVPAGCLEGKAVQFALCWINASFPSPAISSDSHSPHHSNTH